MSAIARIILLALAVMIIGGAMGYASALKHIKKTHVLILEEKCNDGTLLQKDFRMVQL